MPADFVCSIASEARTWRCLPNTCAAPPGWCVRIQVLSANTITSACATLQLSRGTSALSCECFPSSQLFGIRMGIQLQVLSAGICSTVRATLSPGTSTFALFCEYVPSSQQLFSISWLGETSDYINVNAHAVSLHPKHRPWSLDSSFEFMPPQRPAARRRSLRNSRSLTANHRQRSPAPISISIPESVFTAAANTESTATIGSREVSTEPATPSSPTPATGTNRRALRRERSMRILHSVLHYSRALDDLQPWFWCVDSLVSPLDGTIQFY